MTASDAVYSGSTFASAAAQAPVLTLKTDANGVAETTEDNELPVLDEGYYYIVETDSSEGYDRDMTVQRIYAYVDDNGDVACEISTAEKDADGNVDESAWTDAESTVLEDGDYAEVTSYEPPANDPIGTYVIKEISAPQYYQLDGTITIIKNEANSDTPDVGWSDTSRRQHRGDAATRNDRG